MKKETILEEGVFKYLYLFLYFFVFIGEGTKFIVKWFFLRLFFLLRRIFKILLTSLRILRKVFWRFFLFIKGFFYQIPFKIYYFSLGIFTTFLILFFYQSYLFVKSLPSPFAIGKVNFPLSTHLYDRHGKLLYEIYREQNRTPIRLKDLPSYVYLSTVAIEDKDFYKHQGVSFFAILRAMRETFLKHNLQGGSTITQQLVKAALLTPERTWQRKIKEIILALWTEKIYTKDQILEMYLNQVPYGGLAYGIEEAAKTYFGKSAKDLSLEEAALLAGLPQAPSVYSPYVNPQLAKKRRNEVLEAMFRQGYIDKETKEKAKEKELEILPPKTLVKAPHFVFYVKSKLEDRLGTSMVEEGGLRVTTTLDLTIQEEVEKILKEEIEKIRYLNVGNGAVLVTRPKTGEILAMVGSFDYFSSPFGAYNVTLALRQPGSAIKPLLYALALQRGYTAATILDDSPVVFSIPGSEPYRPVNYDNRFHGKIPLRYALANSYNVPAVKVLATLGVDSFIDFATKMGISTWKDRSRFGLSLALGGGEVTMVDMAKAFGVLANQGEQVDLISYLKIKNSLLETIDEPTIKRVCRLNPGISYIISDILSDNFARTWAFGPNSYLEIPGYKVAVKTGTTNDKRDNWTVGYTPEFLVVVWVGNNDNSPMNPYLTSGITGAAPIWNRVMSFLLKNYGSGLWYEKPENVVEKVCYFGRKEYFLKGTENKVNCQASLMTPTPTP